MYLQKAFTKAMILRYFDPECHIHIKTDALRYTICGVLSQISLNQHFSGHVIHKGPNSEIGQ